MDSKTLETFITLAKTRNFTQTADALFLAQSTVTKRIAELERELEHTLFVRTNKTVELTDQGEIFLSYAKRILELEKSSIQKLNTHQCYEKHLKIGTTNALYEAYLVDLISAYTKKEGHAVTVKVGHSNELLLQLQDGLLDVVYSFLPFKKKGYICKPFHSDSMVLVTNYDDLTFAKGITKQDLLNINYLMCNFTIQQVGSYIRELFPVYQQFKFEIDNSTKLLQYLLASNGYSFFPEKMVLPYIKDQKLRKIPLLDFDAPTVTSYVIAKEDVTTL